MCERLAISSWSSCACPAFLAEAFASLDMTSMGVATSFTAAPWANPNFLQVFSNPFVTSQTCICWNETRTIFKPLLHFLIESIVVYF